MIIRCCFIISMLANISFSLCMETKDKQLSAKKKSTSLSGAVRKSLEALFRKQSNPEPVQKSKGQLIIDFESKAEESFQEITPYLLGITKNITQEAFKNKEASRDQIQAAINKIETLDNKTLIGLIALAKKDLITRINIPSWHIATCEYLFRAEADFRKQKNIPKSQELMKKVVAIEDEIGFSIDQLEIKRSINKVMAHLLKEIETLKTLNVSAQFSKEGDHQEIKKTLGDLVYEILWLRNADEEKVTEFYKLLKTVNENPQTSHITHLLQRDLDVVHLLRERMTKIANIRLTIAQYYDPSPIQNVRKVEKKPLAMACIYYFKAFDSFLDLACLEQYNQHFRNENLRIIKAFREHSFGLLNKFGLRDDQNALIPALHKYYIESCQRFIQLYPEVKDDDLMTIQTQR